jgi:23S rRNA (guanosine2251-2'-O)-methyltransferase
MSTVRKHFGKSKKESLSEKEKKERKPSKYWNGSGKTSDHEHSLTEVKMTDMAEDTELPENTLTIEWRNAVLEAFRSGKTIDKIYILDGCTDGAVSTIRREARKAGTIMKFVTRERLDQISSTGKHQGVIACAAAYDYSDIEDVFAKARQRDEPPFIIICDNIEDPHNLGAIIRSANLAGAHGVIIPRNRAVGLTATVAKTSAGALNYTPVVKVTNIGQTIDELKERGLWFVCADMDGQVMYDMDLTGPIGLVIGNEGSGVSRLVREKCDMTASIPMVGEIDSLNVSVAAGVLAYEIVRQRRYTNCSHP